MQVVKMKTKLEEKIKELEKEKSTLLEEVEQLKEVVELSEKTKDLENEVNRLKKEVKTLRDKIPQEFLQELSGVTSALLNDEGEGGREVSEECINYKEE